MPLGPFEYGARYISISIPAHYYYLLQIGSSGKQCTPGPYANKSGGSGGYQMEWAEF